VEALDEADALVMERRGKAVTNAFLGAGVADGLRGQDWVGISGELFKAMTIEGKVGAAGFDGCDGQSIALRGRIIWKYVAD
jgi:hypothetical protein